VWLQFNGIWDLEFDFRAAISALALKVAPLPRESFRVVLLTARCNRTAAGRRDGSLRSRTGTARVKGMERITGYPGIVSDGTVYNLSPETQIVE